MCKCINLLKTLQLWNNRISNEGAFFLKTLLEDYNDALTNLLLSDNFIDEEDILNVNYCLLEIIT